jgi:hypothetical protein
MLIEHEKDREHSGNAYADVHTSKNSLAVDH